MRATSFKKSMYQISRVRIKRMIETVLLLLGPILYPLQVVLRQIRIQHQHLLHPKIQHKHHQNSSNLHKSQPKKLEKLLTLLSITFTMSRPRSLSLNGLHFTATCTQTISHSSTYSNSKPNNFDFILRKIETKKLK